MTSETKEGQNAKSLSYNFSGATCPFFPDKSDPNQVAH